MDSRSTNTKRLLVEKLIPKRQRSFAGHGLLRAFMRTLLVFASLLATGSVASIAQRVLAQEEVFAQEVLVQEVIDPAREASVKAVFLYSYGRYTVWPQEGPGKIEGDFVIGVLGDSPVTAKLQRIAKKRTIAGHPIKLIHIESFEKIPHCQILYVAGPTDEKRQKAIVEATAGQSLLLVGESDGFAERGAAINFYTSGNSVRFQINAETVRQRGLQLKAQLLNLGDRVGGPPGN